MDKRRKNTQNGRSHPKRKTIRYGGAREKQANFSPKDTPGVIYVERQTHDDDAVVVSGALAIENSAEDLGAWLEEEIETAAREVRERGGIVGQIKAVLTVTSTSVMSVSDQDALEKESPKKHARIILTAIMFMIDPKEAENTVRKSLAGVRTRLREKNRTGEKDIENNGTNIIA